MISTTDKRKYIFISIWILAIMTSSTIFMMLKLINESAECVAGPFVYGAQEVYNTQGLDLSCSCSILNPGYSGFNFDRNGVYIDPLGANYTPLDVGPNFK